MLRSPISMWTFESRSDRADRSVYVRTYVNRTWLVIIGVSDSMWEVVVLENPRFGKTFQRCIVHMCTYVRVHMCTYVCVYIYIYVCIYIYTHMRVYMYLFCSRKADEYIMDRCFRNQILTINSDKLVPLVSHFIRAQFRTLSRCVHFRVTSAVTLVNPPWISLTEREINQRQKDQAASKSVPRKMRQMSPWKGDISAETIPSPSPAPPMQPCHLFLARRVDVASSTCHEQAAHVADADE